MSKWNKPAVVLGAGLILALGAGCSSSGSASSWCPVRKVQNAPPDELNDSPLVVDDAMQLRDWDRASATYANGNTPAGPTEFPYEPKWNQPNWVYPVVETPLFVGQSVLMPITMIFTPPWTPVMWKGATIDTTYTAMPALPPAPEVPDSAVPVVPAAEPAPVVVPATQSQ